MIADDIHRDDRILLDGREVTITTRDDNDGHILLFGISEWPGRIWLGKAEHVRLIDRPGDEYKPPGPASASIRLGEADVLYCMLDDLRSEVGWDDGANYVADIDAFLARFPDRAALLRWTASAVDSQHSTWIDDQHDWWSAEMGEVEDYADARVHELLNEETP